MIRTARLLLRQWRDEDFGPFAALNADPEVREYFGGVQSRADSDASATRVRRHIEQHGFGFWAAELPGEASFIGFVGLKHLPEDVPFAPGVEVGWRLARAYWGRGLATEGALAARDHGFGALGLRELVAYAAAGNARSVAVMRRIGMHRGETFEHAEFPPGHMLRPHVVYRMAAPA